MPTCPICLAHKKPRQFIPGCEECSKQICLDCLLSLPKMHLCYNWECETIHYECPMCRSDSHFTGGLEDSRITNHPKRLSKIIRFLRERSDLDSDHMTFLMRQSSDVDIMLNCIYQTLNNFDISSDKVRELCLTTIYREMCHLREQFSWSPPAVVGNIRKN